MRGLVKPEMKSGWDDSLDRNSQIRSSFVQFCHIHWYCLHRACRNATTQSPIVNPVLSDANIGTFLPSNELCRWHLIACCETDCLTELRLVRMECSLFYSCVFSLGLTGAFRWSILNDAYGRDAKILWCFGLQKGKQLEREVTTHKRYNPHYWPAKD